MGAVELIGELRGGRYAHETDAAAEGIDAWIGHGNAGRDIFKERGHEGRGRWVLEECFVGGARIRGLGV